LNYIRREESTGSGQDGDEDIITLVDFTETFGKKVVEVLVESIELVRSVEGDDRNAILVRNGNELFVRHNCEYRRESELPLRLNIKELSASTVLRGAEARGLISA
jgi:hypothetical protein